MSLILNAQRIIATEIKKNINIIKRYTIPKLAMLTPFVTSC